MTAFEVGKLVGQHTLEGERSQLGSELSSEADPVAAPSDKRGKSARATPGRVDFHRIGGIESHIHSLCKSEETLRDLFSGELNNARTFPGGTTDVKANDVLPGHVIRLVYSQPP